MLKATHLQSFFEQVKRVSEGFADDSGTAATNKVFNIAWEAERGEDSEEGKKRISKEFWLKIMRGKLKLLFTRSKAKKAF